MIESEKSNRMLEIFFRALHGEAISTSVFIEKPLHFPPRASAEISAASRTFWQKTAA